MDAFESKDKPLIPQQKTPSKEEASHLDEKKQYKKQEVKQPDDKKQSAKQPDDKKQDAKQPDNKTQKAKQPDNKKQVAPKNQKSMESQASTVDLFQGKAIVLPPNATNKRNKYLISEPSVEKPMESVIAEDPRLTAAPKAKTEEKLMTAELEDPLPGQLRKLKAERALKHQMAEEQRQAVEAEEERRQKIEADRAPILHISEEEEGVRNDREDAIDN